MAKRGESKVRHAKAKAADRHREAVLSSTPEALLVAFNSKQQREPQIFDLTSWRRLGAVAEDFAEGVRRYGTTTRDTSRRAHWQRLEDGLVAFLSEDRADQDLVLESITTARINRFRTWLDRRISAKGKPLKDDTKRGLMSAARTLLRKLKPNLKKLNLKVEFPKNPWPNLGKGSKTEPMARSLYEACLKAIVEGTKEAVEFEHLVRAFHGQEEPTAEEKELLAVLRKLLSKHGGILPERKQLPAEDQHLAASVGYTKMRKIIYPQTNDLAPVFLFIIIFTGFNQQPLASLKLSDMTKVNLLGTDRLLLAPLKHRGESKVRRSLIETAERLSPVAIIEFVRLWTSFIRKSARPAVANDLFIFCMKWKKAGGDWVRSFGETTNGRYEAVQRAVGQFLSQRLGKWVGTRQLRANFADFIGQLVDGDLDAIGVLLGHRSRSTTAGSYRASKARERDEIAMAGGITMRQRLVRSEGKVDPRPLPSDQPRTAATPGWDCLDVFLSPIPGQIDGRACSAYGWCPACPLGRRTPDEPLALARALQLKEVFADTKDHMGVKQFESQFGEPERALLERHIPELASDENVRRARLLTLNPLPKIR